MDEVARLKGKDRADLFNASAAKRRLTAPIIEKDFWVCWTLKQLFSLEAPPAGLLFKGGTSLSKVFGIIDRFSEDVDLSFDRAALGFGGDNDPLHAPSGKKKKQGVEDLKAACQAMIAEQFLPQVQERFRAALGPDGAETWGLTLADDDPDGQTILFRYPSAITALNAAAYIRPMVRLEMGARSDHWPAGDGMVMPYAAEDVPQAFKVAPRCKVHVLSAERTFWEKATVLHAWYHARADKPFRDRQSRHYYDVVRLWEKGPGRVAVKDTALLATVAEHKSVFFKDAAARYDEAKPGTLRLVPPETRIPELQADYEKMREMIFGEPPPFEKVLAVLREIEEHINR